MRTFVQYAFLLLGGGMMLSAIAIGSVTGADTVDTAAFGLALLVLAIVLEFAPAMWRK